MIEKKVYAPPTVEKLGTLAEITWAAGNMGIADGGMSPNHKS
jgi:hypothetical protein